jgi:ribosomal protein S18 acetylase RimI-like enzyme
MNDNLIIRQATIADAAIITNLSVTTFIDAFGSVNTKEDMDKYISECMSLQRLSEEIEDTGSLFLLAVLDGSPVGYTKLRWTEIPDELTGTKPIEIERIYVLQQYQNRKVGIELMNYCINYGLSNNYDTIWLGVWEHNTNAIRFYERAGFQLFGKHDFVLGTDVQTDVLMKKALS